MSKKKLSAEQKKELLKTLRALRLSGAIFCDYRYGHVFVYHNGASSYYAARGFRGSLRI